MPRFDVRVDPAAERDLIEIGRYIAGQAGERIALDFVTRLEEACLSLAEAPHRGTKRDELRPGLRTFGVERRVTIMTVVDDQAQQVIILGVLYGGRDIAAALARR